jgi:hypothetical protein
MTHCIQYIHNCQSKILNILKIKNINDNFITERNKKNISINAMKNNMHNENIFE